jgi:hypothetical protein
MKRIPSNPFGIEGQRKILEILGADRVVVMGRNCRKDAILWEIMDTAVDASTDSAGKGTAATHEQVA